MTHLPAALLVSLLAAACAAPPPVATESPTAPTLAIATVVDGRYRVTLELPKDTWAAGEPITGKATLSLAPGPDALLSGSGGAIGFTFTEVNGTRQMGAGFTADCARHPLSAASPMVKPLTRSGGWSEDMPDAAFYRDFFTAPTIRLPAGDWDIGVELALLEGGNCRGRDLTMDPVVRIQVMP